MSDSVHMAQAPADPIELIQEFRRNIDLKKPFPQWREVLIYRVRELRKKMLGEEYWVVRTLENMVKLLQKPRWEREKLIQELDRRARGIVQGLQREAHRDRWDQRPAS